MIFQTHLDIGFASETNEHEQKDGNDIVIEAGPVVDFESSHEGSHQHEKYRSRSKNRTTWHKIP